MELLCLPLPLLVHRHGLLELFVVVVVEPFIIASSFLLAPFVIAIASLSLDLQPRVIIFRILLGQLAFAFFFSLHVVFSFPLFQLQPVV
jgi:hypothetical protein